MVEMSPLYGKVLSTLFLEDTLKNAVRFCKWIYNAWHKMWLTVDNLMYFHVKVSVISGFCSCVPRHFRNPDQLMFYGHVRNKE